ncbi:hypothetical protein KI387_024725, partial [Taxus chinensis]
QWLKRGFVPIAVTNSPLCMACRENCRPADLDICSESLADRKVLNMPWEGTECALCCDLGLRRRCDTEKKHGIEATFGLRFRHDSSGVIPFPPEIHIPILHRLFLLKSV